MKDKLPKLPGPGLKKEGIIFLQTVLIAFFTWVENLFAGEPGMLSGLAIIVATYGAVAYGRKGTQYVSAATPPLAYAGVLIVLAILRNGIKPSRVGLDVISNLAAVAPYLVIAAIYGWFVFLNEKAKSKPPKKKAGHTA